MSIFASDSKPDSTGGLCIGDHVIVEEAGAATGVYKKVGLEDGVSMYMLDSKAFRLHRRRGDHFGAIDEWCITDERNKTWFSAPFSTSDPNHPPSSGWSQSISYSRGFGLSPQQIRSLPKVTVKLAKKPCALIYEKLLFSEEYSDSTIVCEDEVAIPVHKNILAASSPYFKAAFSGQWQENQSGVIKTEHPAHIIKETLALIYTGESSTNLIQEAPLAFISVASEFDLPWLKELAEPNCVKSLNEINLKGAWQAGRLYESDALKKGCIVYAKKNALSILTKSTIVDLKSEDPTSWQDFVTAVESK